MSVLDLSDITAGDRSPRARIRDAALAEFGAHGFRGATVRGIAEAAGVSTGLVQHHYPTKDDLRSACDEYAVAVIRRVTEQAYSDDRFGDPAFVASVYEAMRPVVQYLSSALALGDTAAEQWFDEFVLATRGALEARWAGDQAEEDLEAMAAVWGAMQVGLTLLLPQIARTLGLSPDSRELMARVGRARMALTSDKLIDEDLAVRAREGLARFEQGDSQ